MHKKLTFSEFCGGSYETEVSHKFIEYLKLCFRTCLYCPIVIHLFQLTNHFSERNPPTLHTRSKPWCSSATATLHDSGHRPPAYDTNHPSPPSSIRAGIGFDRANSNSSQDEGTYPCHKTRSSKCRKPRKFEHSPGRSAQGTIT